MKEFYIKDHHPDCKFGIPNEWCGCHMEEFFFQYDYSFYLISFNSCLNKWMTHLEKKEWILGLLCDSKKEAYNVQRSHKIDDDFLKKVSIDVLTKDVITEVISLYSDNAGKQYAFVKYHSFEDFCLLSVGYNERFIEASKLLDEGKARCYGMESISMLKLWNEKPLSKKQSITLTDLLTKQIFKECKATKTY